MQSRRGAFPVAGGGKWEAAGAFSAILPNGAHGGSCWRGCHAGSDTAMEGEEPIAADFAQIDSGFAEEPCRLATYPKHPQRSHGPL
jgi:hypothetical protein